MSAPSAWQKLLYLSGAKSAPEDHRDWISSVLAMPDRRRLGLLLALPNAAIMVTAGLILFAILGDPAGVIFFVGAVVVLITGRAMPSLSRRRAQTVAKKNDLPPPEW